MLEWGDEFIKSDENDEVASVQMTCVSKANLSGHEKVFIMSSRSITDRKASFTKLHVPLLGYIEID